jgi:hypothetical protein
MKYCVGLLRKCTLLLWQFIVGSAANISVVCHFLEEVLISVEFSLSDSRFLRLQLSLPYHGTSFRWKQKTGDALQMIVVTCFRRSGRP